MIGVTIALLVVTTVPFNVSFPVTFTTVTIVFAEAIVIGPSFTAIITFATTGIVKVADVGATAPLLSVAVNVNVSLPVKVPFGSYVKVAACAGVNT